MEGDVPRNPRLFSGWAPETGKGSYTQDEVMRHFITGYHTGFYSSPGEVFDTIKWHRDNTPSFGSLPPGFEDKVLANIGFRRVIDDPRLPARIERLPDNATGVAGLIS